MENLFKSSKPLQENFGSESFKRMPFVSFFLYILMAFFVLAAFAELCLTFGLHDVNWINSKRIIYINFAYIELIIGILSVINVISIILILKSIRNGFWIITYSSAIASFVLALCSQCFNIEYNRIGNLVLMQNLFTPFILWTVLNLKNDKGKSQWQYLK